MWWALQWLCQRGTLQGQHRRSAQAETNHSAEKCCAGQPIKQRHQRSRQNKQTSHSGKPLFAQNRLVCRQRKGTLQSNPPTCSGSWSGAAGQADWAQLAAVRTPLFALVTAGADRARGRWSGAGCLRCAAWCCCGAAVGVGRHVRRPCGGRCSGCARRVLCRGSIEDQPKLRQIIVQRSAVQGNQSSKGTSGAGRTSRPATQGLGQNIAGLNWHGEQLFAQNRLVCRQRKGTMQSNPPTCSGSWSGAAGQADWAQLAAVRIPLFALVAAGADRARGRWSGAGCLWCAAWGCCGAAVGVGRHVGRPCGGRCSGGARGVLCRGSRETLAKLRQNHHAKKCCARQLTTQRHQQVEQADQPLRDFTMKTAGSSWHKELLLEQNGRNYRQRKATMQSTPPTWSGSWSGAAGPADWAQLAAVRVPLFALVAAGADRARGRWSGAGCLRCAAWCCCGAAVGVGRHVRRPCGGRCSGGAGCLWCAAWGCCGAAVGVGRHVGRPCGGRCSGGARGVLCRGSRETLAKLRQNHHAKKCCARQLTTQRHQQVEQADQPLRDFTMKTAGSSWHKELLLEQNGLNYRQRKATMQSTPPTWSGSWSGAAGPADWAQLAAVRVPLFALVAAGANRARGWWSGAWCCCGAAVGVGRHVGGPCGGRCTGHLHTSARR